MRRLLARFRRSIRWIPRPVRRIIVLVIGGTVLLIGIIMIIAPGPAVVVVPLGLAILALEFAWARRWLAHIKRGANHVKNRMTRKSQAGASPSNSPMR